MNRWNNLFWDWKKFCLAKTSKFPAFTLAEVLITVVIIGVVAALTLPVLITNYKKYTTAVQLHKFYNDMTYAVEMYKKENNIDKIEIKCGSNSSSSPAVCNIYDLDVSFDASKNWWVNTLGKYVKYVGDVQRFVYEDQKAGYVREDGTVVEHDVSNFMGKVILKDGTCFTYYLWNEDRDTVHFFYSTNVKTCTGYNGGIDLMDGRDTFLFSLEDSQFKTAYEYIVKDYSSGTRDSNGNLCDRGANSCYGDRSALLKSCSKESARGKRGACSRLIELDGWKIKPDYPWRATN